METSPQRECGTCKAFENIHVYSFFGIGDEITNANKVARDVPHYATTPFVMVSSVCDGINCLWF